MGAAGTTGAAAAGGMGAAGGGAGAAGAAAATGAGGGGGSVSFMALTRTTSPTNPPTIHCQRRRLRLGAVDPCSVVFISCFLYLSVVTEITRRNHRLSGVLGFAPRSVL
jgi:hypothetical protein